MNILSVLSKSAGVRKYALNTLWLFAENAQKLILAFVVGVFVTRYLGPTEYGKLTYSQGFVGLFAAITHMGLNSIVVRDLVRNRFSTSSLLGAAWFLQLLGGGIVCIAVAIGITFTSSGDQVRTMVMIIAAAETLKSFGVISLFFQAKVASKNLAKVSLFQSVTTSIIKILLIVLGANVLWFAVVVLIDACLSAIGLAYIYQLSGNKILEWKVNFSVIKDLLADSWPMIFYGVALFIQARIDQVMIGEILGSYEVGQYSVALRMIETLGFIPAVIAKSVSPAITKAKEESLEKYRGRLQNSYRLFFLIFLVMGIPIFIGAEWMISLIFGDSYRPAGILLSLFAIRLFFTNMGIAKSAFITNENLFKYSLFTAIVGAISNVTINYFLIPELGAKGAILATIISFGISMFLLDLCFSYMRQNLKDMFTGIISFWKIDLKSIK